jgi:hypothetical protein
MNSMLRLHPCDGLLAELGRVEYSEVGVVEETVNPFPHTGLAPNQPQPAAQRYAFMLLSSSRTHSRWRERRSGAAGLRRETDPAMCIKTKQALTDGKVDKSLSFFKLIPI